MDDATIARAIAECDRRLSAGREAVETELFMRRLIATYGALPDPVGPVPDALIAGHGGIGPSAASGLGAGLTRRLDAMEESLSRIALVLGSIASGWALGARAPDAAIVPPVVAPIEPHPVTDEAAPLGPPPAPVARRRRGKDIGKRRSRHGAIVDPVPSPDIDPDMGATDPGPSGTDPSGDVPGFRDVVSLEDGRGGAAFQPVVEPDRHERPDQLDMPWFPEARDPMPAATGTRLPGGAPTVPEPPAPEIPVSRFPANPPAHQERVVDVIQSVLRQARGKEIMSAVIAEDNRLVRFFDTGKPSQHKSVELKISGILNGFTGYGWIKGPNGGFMWEGCQ